MKFFLLILIMVISYYTPCFSENTGSDSDFEGAEIAIPKKSVKTLDDTKFTDHYSDYSEFREEEDAEELAAEAFYSLGRMLGVGFDLGVAGFTQGYGTMNDLGPRVGLRVIYFFGISFAVELGLHYQKHGFHIYSSDGFNAFEGTNTIVDVEVAGKYYFDTRDWSDFISWLNPHVSLGLEFLTITIDAPYGPATPVSGPNAYMINEMIWSGAAGFGFEFKLFSSTYLSVDAKYHYGVFPDEDIYEYDYSFTGDMWSVDAGIILYF